ncbi:hypothetical protein GIY23_21330 [Allosaccharopolyspora coralli]|uniref:Uncharacterized protein n=1 Tax=Allosaccharopolyspora coralli TaxID=2665642 RepID=A0A5Q3QAY1_9PSEU|nr:hypothetical protein [Allosaccharopolyspora coralli]QGK71718.1 hypothetical protein GIY23_21330 [Allosaccharopolyspora coralli]
MSEDLMSQAQALEEKAITVAVQELRRKANRGDGPPIEIPREHVEQDYRGRIAPLFEPFTRMPEASSYTGAIEAANDAMKQLSSGEAKDPISGGNILANPDLARAESAGDTLHDWTGAAADNFKRNFLDKFPYIAQNQFLLLGVLKGALEADQNRWGKADEDIRFLAQAVNDGLDNVLGCGKNELAFTFSVVSAVAAVGAIPFTGGASAVIAAVGAAGSVGNAGVAASKVVKKPGGSVDQVLKSMEDAIRELTKEIQDSGGKIAEALNGITGQVQGAKDSFVSPRPALAGMEGDVTTSERGLGGVN